MGAGLETDVDASTINLRVHGQHARPARGVTTSASPIAARPKVRQPTWVLLVTADAIALLSPCVLFSHGRWSLVAMAATDLILLRAAGQYRSRLTLSFLDDVVTLVARGLTSFLLVAGISRLVGVRSVREFAPAAALAISVQLLARLFAYKGIALARLRGLICHRTLLLGAGEVAGKITAALETRTAGLQLIGYVADGVGADSAPTTIPFLGETSELSEIIEAYDISIVIVAFSVKEDSALVELLRRSERRGCDLFIVPRLFEIYNYGQSEHIGSIPIVRVKRPRLNSTTWLIKRGIDIAASTAALVLLSPLLAVTAIAVRLEGGPGVIFRQTRIGLDGREFQLLKFRSLAPVGPAESATLWSVTKDHRIGPVGRFIRRTSIDELPQLVNVWRGEMTLVGPRPERPHFVRQFVGQIPDYRYRYRVPAGLTGLAQINGLRGDTSIVERANFDNFYIENWSLWLDIKIMMATLRELVGARGG